MLINEMLYDLNMEAAVLASMIKAGFVEEVYAILKKEDFFDKFYRVVFEEIGKIYNEYAFVDEALLEKELKAKGVFNENKFNEIVSTAPVISVEAYAKKLKDLSIKRALSYLSDEIKKLLATPDKSGIEDVEEVHSKLLNIIKDNVSGDFKSSEEVVINTISYIKEQISKENKLITGVDTGFVELNRMTSGFGHGDLVIIAARPSMGKTAVALNIALNVLKQNLGVAIFSLEMPAEQLMLRMLSAESKIPLQNLRRGDLSDDEFSRLSQVADMVSKYKLFVEDEGNINIHTIKAKLKKLKADNDDLSLVIIDYLQLIASSQRERHLAIAEISRELKLLARELNIPIIALSQLNRSLESRPNKRPMLSDLRESGAIEQDADIIMFIYRDSVYKMMEAKQKQKEAEEKGKVPEAEYKMPEVEDVEIIIGKQRNGPIGTVMLRFHKSYTLFTDIVEEVGEIEPTNTTIDSPFI